MPEDALMFEVLALIGALVLSIMLGYNLVGWYFNK